MKKNRIYSAFTLAEMMVVMLILSIVMAAFAPVVTTRSKSDRNSPWRYAPDNSNIYYGLGENQTAMIGQPIKKLDIDPSVRLLINTSDDNQKHIAFKRGEDNLLGYLYMSANSLVLGNGSTSGSNNLAFGKDALKSNITGYGNFAGGTSSLFSNKSGSYNIALGFNTLYNTNSNYNIGIGSQTLYKNTGYDNVAIGHETMFYNTNGNDNTAVGVNALNASLGSENAALGFKTLKSATTSYNTAIGAYANSDLTNGGSYTTAIGYKSQALGSYSSALGYNSKASGENAVSLGNESESTNGAVAIGYQAKAKDYDDIALGNNAYAYEGAVSIGKNSKATYYSVALGNNTEASGSDGNSISLGNSAKAYKAGDTAIGGSSYADGGSAIAIGQAEAKGSSGIALGYGAKANNTNNIAIGNRACQYAKGANKVCIGANSGPRNGDSQASDNVERIYIGSQGVFQPPEWTDGKRGQSVAAVTYHAPLEIHKNGNESTIIMNSNLIIRGNIFFLARKYDRFGAVYQTYGSDDINIATDVREPLVSDRRLKYVGNEITSGLDKIKKLKVFNYTFKKDEKKTPHVGVIAQDLQKVFPDAVKKGDDGYLTIRWEDMFYALINAVKELDTKVTLLINQENAKDKKIKELETRLDKLEKQLK